MSVINNINERIKAARKKLELRQKVMAKSIGISQGYWSDIEGGRRIPSDTILIALANRWSIRLDWLMDGEGEMFIPKVAEGMAIYGTGICSSEQKEVWEQIDYIFDNGSEDDINMLMGAVERIFIRTKKAEEGKDNEDRKPVRFQENETAEGKQKSA